MFSANRFIQNVCMLLIFPFITSTVKHHYESDTLYHSTTDHTEYNTTTSKDADNFVRAVVTHSTTKRSTSDVTSRKSSNNAQDKDKADRNTCNGDSFDVEKCVIYLQRKLLKDTPIKAKLGDWLKKLALCLHTNGSIVQINPERQMCCNGVMNKTAHEECCEGKVFDNRERICCNKTLYEKTNRSGCCGSYLYDIKEELCCNGSLPLVRRQQTMECCGNQAVNISKNVCCNGNIQPMHGLRNKKGNCCNQTSYHIGCHTCENGTSLYAQFDDTLEICCQGKMMNRMFGNSSECCQRRVMNNDTYMCVADEVVPKPKSEISQGMYSMYACLTDALTTASQPLVTSGSNEKSIEAWEDENLSKTVYVTIYTVVLTSLGSITILGCLFWAICKAYQSTTIKEDIEFKKLDKVNESIQARKCYMFGSPLLENKCEEDSFEETCYINEIDKSENENVCPSEYPKTSGHMTLPDVLSNIEKNSIIYQTNLISTHFKEIQTQTVQENVVKRRTIFGHSFEHHMLLNESNTTLEIPGSDVSFSFPKRVIDKNIVEVNCTSFSSLPDLRQKLGLSEDEELISPVVEFAVTGYCVLPEHVRVVLPFLGNASDLIVRTFQSDEGLNSVAISEDIAEKHKQNEDIDSFYTTEGPIVIIYTKILSGFFCTRYRHNRWDDFSLCAFIFGSYKRINRRYEVGISIYIADEIFKFKDYQKRMVENETRQERGQLKVCVLSIPDNFNDVDNIEASIDPGNKIDKWIHRLHPRTKKPLQEKRKEIRLGCIAQKCKKCLNFHAHELEIPYCSEWYLTTERIDTIPSEIFQCTINLNICKRDAEFKIETRVFIEKLMLRSKDRLEAKDDSIAVTTLANQVHDVTCSAGPSMLRIRSEESLRTTPGFQLELIHLSDNSHIENDLTMFSVERSSSDLPAPPPDTPGSSLSTFSAADKYK